jgi:predicted RNA-binding protein YlqC (UPF0109 family)
MMARRRRSALALSAEHARQALAILVQEGKLKAADVGKALQRRDRLIRALRASLAALESGAGKVARQFKGSPFSIGRKARAAKRPAKRRKPRISAATRKLYQQQGRYMAVLRPLSKEQRAEIKTVREKSGVRAAVAAAKRMAK